MTNHSTTRRLTADLLPQLLRRNLVKQLVASNVRRSLQMSESRFTGEIRKDSGMWDPRS